MVKTQMVFISKQFTNTDRVSFNETINLSIDANYVTLKYLNAHQTLDDIQGAMFLISSLPTNTARGCLACFQPSYSILTLSDSASIVNNKCGGKIQLANPFRNGIVQFSVYDPVQESVVVLTNDVFVLGFALEFSE